MTLRSKVLSQPFTLGFTYTRSTGPVVGRFLTELRVRRIVGTKGSDGRVMVPPMEYDPVTAQALDDFVFVADTGVVKTWCWVSSPREHHLSDKPFAWAQVLLDGASTPMLHMVAADSESDMETGMRVRVRWAEETRGHITDIVCFEPACGTFTSEEGKSDETLPPVTGMEAPIYLRYRFTAGAGTSRYLDQVKQGKLVGQRCPSCRNVYIPPRGSCAACGIPTDEEVELSKKATVESFTIVHIPMPGNPIKPPFVVANIVPDGSNISFIHLIGECANEGVRIGMRVEARWKEASEWEHAMENIRYYVPINEPDVPRDEIGRPA